MPRRKRILGDLMGPGVGGAQGRLLCWTVSRKGSLKLAVFAVCLNILLSGCVPELERPLSDPASAAPDPRLLGMWVGSTPDGEGPAWVHFTQAENSMTDIVLICPETGKGVEASFYRMHPTRAGGFTFMNVKAHKPKNALALKVNEEDKYPRPGGYHLAKYHISSDGILRIWFLTDEISRFVEEGQLKGQVRKSGIAKEVKITESPERLLEFLERSDHSRIFEPFLVCRRVDEKPPPRGAFDGK